MCAILALNLLAVFTRTWLHCLYWISTFVFQNYFSYISIQSWHTQEPYCDLKRESDKLLLQISFCPEILKAIFQESDFYCLKKFRLVCKTWNREICQSMSKKNWLVTMCNKELPAFSRMLMSRGSTLPLPFDRINLFLDPTSHTGGEQYLRQAVAGLKIAEIQLTVPETPYSSYCLDVRKLLKRISPTLASLTTSPWGTWSPSTVLRFPQLRKLQTERVGTWNGFWFDQYQYERQSSFFLNIIAGAPNLTHLMLNDGSNARDILEQANLKSTRVLSIVSSEPISEVDIWDVLERADVGPLTHLTVYIGQRGYSGDDRKCSKTLSRFASTLKSLNIVLVDPALEGTHPSKLPLLQFLTTLQMSDYCPQELDLKNLPGLKHLKFNCLILDSASPRRSQPNSLFSSMVQSVGFEHNVDRRGIGRASPQEEEDAFLDLFQRFPNARTWELNYCNVVSFCRAVERCGFCVSSLSISCGWTELELAVDGRYAVSYVERIEDLVELGLFEFIDDEWLFARVKELDLQKLSKLKVVKLQPMFKKSYTEHYPSIAQLGLKVVVLDTRCLKGNEEILSLKDVEFRSDPR